VSASIKAGTTVVDAGKERTGVQASRRQEHTQVRATTPTNARPRTQTLDGETDAVVPGTWRGAVRDVALSPTGRVHALAMGGAAPALSTIAVGVAAGVAADGALGTRRGACGARGGEAREDSHTLLLVLAVAGGLSVCVSTCEECG
jgi:hypothetical protein